FFKVFYVFRQSKCICWIWVNGIIKYILVFGTDLYIVSCFELTVFHMIFLHSHKRSIGICFTVGVSFAEYLFLCIVLSNICRPVLLGISEFLFPFLVYSFFIFYLLMPC